MPALLPRIVAPLPAVSPSSTSSSSSTASASHAFSTHHGPALAIILPVILLAAFIALALAAWCACRSESQYVRRIVPASCKLSTAGL